jgi:DNA-binding response OmpR family regulator
MSAQINCWREVPRMSAALRVLAEAAGVPESDSAERVPTVLVVDDDLFVCQAVACILHEARGARVLAARDGDEALSLAPAARPDLILLDICMPRTAATEVCRRLRQVRALAGTSICILTGVLPDDELLRELHAYADHVMTKPPDPRKLVAMVDDC